MTCYHLIVFAVMLITVLAAAQRPAAGQPGPAWPVLPLSPESGVWSQATITPLAWSGLLVVPDHTRTNSDFDKKIFLFCVVPVRVAWPVGGERVERPVKE